MLDREGFFSEAAILDREGFFSEAAILFLLEGLEAPMFVFLLTKLLSLFLLKKEKKKECVNRDSNLANLEFRNRILT